MKLVKEGLIIASGRKMCTDRQKSYTLVMEVQIDKSHLENMLALSCKLEYYIPYRSAIPL